MIRYEVGMSAVSVPVPPSTNGLFATIPGGKRVKSKEYGRWLKTAVPLLRLLARPAAYPVTALLTVECKLNAQRDLDNIIKPLIDACKKAGVIADDNVTLIDEVRITYRPSRLGDGVRIQFVPSEGIE